MMQKAAKVAPPVPMDEHNRRLEVVPEPVEVIPAGWSLLSPQERRVLLARATGALEVEVADELGLSLRTVKAYQASARDKLGARNLLEALLAAEVLVFNPALDA